MSAPTPPRKYSEWLQECIDQMVQIVSKLADDTTPPSQMRELESELLVATSGAVVLIARAQIHMDRVAAASGNTTVVS